DKRNNFMIEDDNCDLKVIDSKFPNKYKKE
ncbi:unnamed protein product, partial [marine sediment metagenome]